jgi:hypothetical protein
LLRARPRALFGGASLVIAMSMLPNILAQLLATALPGVLAQILGLLVLLLLFPPVIGGYFRVLHGQAQGEQAPPSALFSIFGDGPALRRLVVGNLILFSATLLLLNVLAALLGGEALFAWVEQVGKLQPGATTLPHFPPGMLPLLLVLGLVGAVSTCVQMLASAELALGERPTLPALLAALAASWRNFGALLLFFLPAALFAFLGVMLALLVVMLVVTMLGAASQLLGQVVLLVAVLLLLVALYALLFGFFYFAWRELFDLPPPPPAPVHQIAA